MSAVDVLAVMDMAARAAVRSCNACVDPTACTDCDAARPQREAREAVAELIDAADELLAFYSGEASPFRMWRALDGVRGAK